MGVIPIVGFGSFVIASLFVGARLLWLARRTRQIPEAALGTAFLCGGGLGYLLVVATFALGALGPRLRLPVMLLGVFFIHLGAAALALGTWKIFRPCDARGRALFAVITAVLAIFFVTRAFDPTEYAYGINFWPGAIAGCASYAWSAAESLHFGVVARRRRRIGLDAGEHADRFLFWGAASVCAVVMHLASMADRWFDPRVADPSILLLQSVLGMGAAITIWSAFFSRRRVLRRERATS